MNIEIIQAYVTLAIDNAVKAVEEFLRPKLTLKPGKPQKRRWWRKVKK
jgi:hypothetical protein